jgi:hypothetical protein
MEAKGRARVATWVAIVVIGAMAGASIWWLHRSRSAAPQERVACQPLHETNAPPSTGPAVRTSDWVVSIASARAVYEVPAEGGGRYHAAPGEVFIRVEVSFRNLHAGHEAPLSTGAVTLTCEDGTKRVPDGLRIRPRGFCRVCAVDLGTEDREVDWGFIYRMDRDFVGQPYGLRYANSDPITFAVELPAGLEQR